MSLAPMLITTFLMAQVTSATPETAGTPHMVRVGAQSQPPPEALLGDAAFLPMTFAGGLPTIEVKINGKGPFRVAFDTGAPGGPHLTSRVAQAAGLVPAGEMMAGDPTGGNQVPVKLYRFENMELGRVSIRGWIASVETSLLGKREGLDGVIGLSAFAGYVVTLDYQHSQFSLRRSSLPPADGRSIFSYEGQMAPTVPLSLEGRTLLAHLDTGNTVTGLIVPGYFAQGLLHRRDAKVAGLAHTISNTIKMFSVPIEGTATIGSTPLSISAVEYPNILPLGNIGSPALMHTVIEVDPLHQRVRVGREN